MATNKPEVETDDAATSNLEFLQQDYWQKVQYLKDHFTRVWNRFNYFLTVQSALFGATVLSPDKYRWWVPIFAALVCILWYVFGAQDRYLVELYRKQIEQSLGLIENRLSLPDNYYLVGQTEDRNNATIKLLDVDGGVYQWRSERLSITRLPALFPLFLLLIWAFILVGILVWGRLSS